MNIESCVTLEMAYYNARLALWEPVIEPVASPHSGSGISSYSPWKLEMNVIRFFSLIHSVTKYNLIYIHLTLQIIMLNQGNEDINQDASSPVEDLSLIHISEPTRPY